MNTTQLLHTRSWSHDTRAFVAAAGAALPLIGFALSTETTSLPRAEQFPWVVPLLSVVAAVSLAAVAVSLARTQPRFSHVTIWALVAGVFAGAVPGGGFVDGTAGMLYWIVVVVSLFFATLSAFDASDSSAD